MHVEPSYGSLHSAGESREGLHHPNVSERDYAAKSLSLQVLCEQTASSSICCTLKNQQSVSYTTTACNGPEIVWSGRAVAVG